jgi:uncharacterized protein (TIGR03437 family)
MKQRLCVLAAVLAGLCFGADTDCKPNAPCYSAASIANIASGEAGALAPNTLARIIGTGLAFSERGLLAGDAAGGELPILLGDTGVHVLISGIPGAPVLCRSHPDQLPVPSNLRAVEVDLQVVRQGVAGPAVRLRLREEAPALFLKDTQYVIASHLDWSLVTADAPARPDRWFVLWATGLGRTNPDAQYGQIPRDAAKLVRKDEFRVYLDGVPVAPERVNYVGLAPLCAGLYQINVLAPATASPDPEVRIGVGESLSPPGTRIHLRP